MKLAYVRLEGVRDLAPVVEHELGSTTVVLAPKGAAKTRFLSAIVAAKERLGAYGSASASRWPERWGRATATLRFELDGEEQDHAALTTSAVERTVPLTGPLPIDLVTTGYGLAAVLSRYTSDGRGGKMELVPAERSLSGGVAAGGLGAARGLALDSSDRKYEGLVGELVELARDAAPAFTAFAENLSRMEDAPRAAGLAREGAKSSLLFSRGSEQRHFDELGLDDRQRILFAALGPVRALRRSIVLVDEPELHLGELAARGLAATLPEVFGPDNQLLIATRSRAVAQAFESRHVVVLDP